MSASSTLDRWSGGCLVAAGVLLLPGTVHPDIFETTLGEASLEPFWVEIHLAALAVSILTLIAVAGLYGSRAARLGLLGAVGFGLVVPGLVLTGAVSWAEALLLPVVARDHPEVFDWNGPVTTDWGVRAGTVLALCWLVGLFLLSLALRRARAVPAGAALTLAVGVAASAVFGGLLIPVLSPLAVAVMAAGHVWIGAALWSGTDPGSSVATDARARPTAPDREDPATAGPGAPGRTRTR
jgi:hypothetical protein